MTKQIKPEIAVALMAIKPQATTLGYEVAAYCEGGIEALVVKDVREDIHALNIRASSASCIIAEFDTLVSVVELGTDKKSLSFEIHGDLADQISEKANFSDQYVKSPEDKLNDFIADLRILSMTTPRLSDIERDNIQDAIKSLSKAAQSIKGRKTV